MFTRTIFLTIFLALMMLATQPTFASPSATIVVDSSADTIADDGACTLREAVENANDDNQSGSTDCVAGNGADVISFAPALFDATITIANGHLFIGGDVTINGHGETHLTLSGNDTNRLFLGSQGSLTLTDMTLTAGNITNDARAEGGCIYMGISTNTLTLSNVTIHSCSVNSASNSARGGAIYAAGDAIDLTNVTLENNEAHAATQSARGGAIWTQSGTTVTLLNVTAVNNLARADLLAYGGAFYINSAPTWNWTEGFVVGNSAESTNGFASGGGIYVHNDTSADWTDVTLHNNQATFDVTTSPQNADGGGMRFWGDLTANNLIVTENSVTTNPPDTDKNMRGGGLYLLEGTVVLNNSRIEDNVVGDLAYLSAAHEGGGLSIHTSNVTLNNTIVTGNSATVGGGITLVATCSSGNITLTGGQIQNNVAHDSGGGIEIHSSGTFNCPIILTDSTISNNSALTAGGILSAGGGFVTIDNSTITANHALIEAGGIRNFTDQLVIRNSTISQNVAEGNGRGGGIANDASSELTIETSTSIVGNSATREGGGIYNEGQLTLNGIAVSNNSSDQDGGGIFNEGQLDLDNVSVSDNSAERFGGGLAVQDGSATLQRVTFDNNSAVTAGGGIALLAATTNPITLIQSTLSDNSAAAGGGVYATAGASGTIGNTTFSANAASGSGSGVRLINGDLTLTNVTIADGTGSSGIDNQTGTLFLNNSIVANNAGAECVGTIKTTDAVNLATDGTCSASIVDASPKLDVLKDNGGQTLTMALLAGSPAIDAGDDTVCEKVPVDEVDQRGVARPTGASCDLGAYEVGDFVPTAVTLQNATTESSPTLRHLILPIIMLITLVGTHRLHHKNP